MSDRHAYESKWTRREVATLARLYAELSREKFAERFGRTPVAVTVKAKRLGLRKRKYVERPWTDAEIAVVLDPAAGSFADKARRLWRTRSQVSSKVFRLRKTQKASHVDV